jgi:ribonuclease HI
MIGSSLKILQVNLNKSSEATESALQIAVEQKVDLIIVQEPWLTGPHEPPDYSNTRSTLHQAFTQILPHIPNKRLRPRTLVYVSRSFRPLVSLVASSPQDPDLLVVDITEGNTKIQLLNVYNETDQLGTGLKTLPRVLYTQALHTDSITLGDFNTHHPWWDPLGQKGPGADDLVDWIEEQRLELLNTPGCGTFFRSNMTRETVIDLTLVTNSLASRVHDWEVLPALGSDHKGILFSVTGSGTKTSLNLTDHRFPAARYKTELANWDLFSRSLQSHVVHSPTLNSPEFIALQANEPGLGFLMNQCASVTTLLDSAASELTQAITEAANASIPTSKPGARPKPWWNDELRDLRKDMIHKQRSFSQDPDSREEYLQSKNKYFQAIKQAKRTHWNNFLEKEDPQSIYKALAYTKDYQNQKLPSILGKDNFPDKCDILRQTLFPLPPNAPEPDWTDYRPAEWDWPNLTQAELQSACSAKIKGKTPGPDCITQEIILNAYNAIPDTFFTIYSNLLNIGYHPPCWKQATGAILKKAEKPDYTAPKAYRVISLLNCLGKVSERILAQRLGHLAETTTLIHPTQIGGRKHKSAIDAALLLTNEVESNRRLKRKTTTLFLDIKGAFDHVAKNQLLAILQALRLPTSLISWTSSFLDNRLLRLSFDGQTEDFASLNTGIPQGSPISPILFLIYIRDLFPSLASSIKVLSYLDDISLTVSSYSLKKNTKILEREAAKLYSLGAKSAIEFDLDKTELIHFTTSKEAKTASLQLPNGATIQPKELVRWLGIWFDPGLTFKHHVAKRVSQARSTLQRMNRLANSERGLSPLALRQLYLACVTSVADYGSPVWWKGQAQFKRSLQALQNLALRKILGVFKTAPILPMEVEAALVPPDIRLDASTRQYALRMLKLSATHPINQELSALLPTEPGAKPRPKTQMERIRGSIEDVLADVDSIETIQHFKYPPWSRTPPYAINISNMSKEETATVHNSNQGQHPENTISIYTDASAIPNGNSTGIGVGLVAVDLFGHQIHQSKSNLGPSQLVYNGELEGIAQAVEHASHMAQPGQIFQIYSDNQAALHRLKNLSDEPGQECQIRATLATELAISKGATISINWVPGHTNVPGNELADSLAKEATELAPDSDNTSHAHLRSMIREVKFKEWKSVLDKYESLPSQNPIAYKKLFSWKINSKIQLPPGTKRQVASAFYQLKLGHGFLKSYLNRIGRSDNDRCRCGKKETAEHLLLSCKDLAAARSRLRDRLQITRLNLKLLLHTKTGIEKTLGFLKETGIATRSWHLQRKEQEEEEQRRAEALDEEMEEADDEGEDVVCEDEEETTDEEGEIHQG